MRRPPQGPMDDDKERYMRWLERMWDVQKLDPRGNTDREERRTEEILTMFKDLGELARRRVELPEAQPWGEPD